MTMQLNMLDTNVDANNWKYCPVCLVRTEHKDGQCTSKFHSKGEKLYMQRYGITGEKNDQER